MRISGDTKRILQFLWDCKCVVGDREDVVLRLQQYDTDSVELAAIMDRLQVSTLVRGQVPFTSPMYLDLPRLCRLLRRHGETGILIQPPRLSVGGIEYDLRLIMSEPPRYTIDQQLEWGSIGWSDEDVEHFLRRAHSFASWGDQSLWLLSALEYINISPDIMYATDGYRAFATVGRQYHPCPTALVHASVAAIASLLNYGIRLSVSPPYIRIRGMYGNFPVSVVAEMDTTPETAKEHREVAGKLLSIINSQAAYSFDAYPQLLASVAEILEDAPHDRFGIADVLLVIRPPCLFLEHPGILSPVNVHCENMRGDGLCKIGMSPRLLASFGVLGDNLARFTTNGDTSPLVATYRQDVVIAAPIDTRSDPEEWSWVDNGRYGE